MNRWQNCIPLHVRLYELRRDVLPRETDHEKDSVRCHGSLSGPVVCESHPPPPPDLDVAMFHLPLRLLHQFEEVLDPPYLSALHLLVEAPVRGLGNLPPRAGHLQPPSQRAAFPHPPILPRNPRGLAPLELARTPSSLLLLTPLPVATPRNSPLRGDGDRAEPDQPSDCAASDRVLYQVRVFVVEDDPVLPDAEYIGR